MFEPLQLQAEKLLLHPFQADDLKCYEQRVSEIFQLLSDEETLRFIPEKRLESLAEAEQWLKTALLNSHSGRNSVHLITGKKSGALMGIVDIIPPLVAKEHYRLQKHPYFIEFYLKAGAKGKMVMTDLLPRIVLALKSQGIENIAAVVNRKNIAASKVLGRSGFVYHGPFDVLQDFYAYKQVGCQV